MPGEKTLVCVAWPYANGTIHLGHMAGSIMPAEIFARYHRLIGDDVLMISGSDMHGTPITVRAEKEHTTPEEVAFRFHDINKRALEGIGTSFDLYTSTHTDNHVKTTQEIFNKLLERGYLEKRTTPQFYCAKCDRYLPDRFVEGSCPFCGHEKARGDQCETCGKTFNADELKDPKCQLCSSTPALRDTEHFFFMLTKFEDALKQYVGAASHWRPRVKGFTENILNEGLQDRAITRDISWGIPVPVAGFEDKRIYVWFEAVIGYLSASKEWAAAKGDSDAWKRYWTDSSCRSYYFLGKDNTIFHTIIWPAIIMGYGGLNLPYDVPANEFMNLEGQKFSKSAGVSIDLPDMLEKFQPDAIRYYLSVNMPEIKDTEFSWEDFVAKVNNELVAAYGNFVHRVLSFTQKNFGEIPPVDKAPQTMKDEVFKQIESARDAYQKAVGNCDFKLGLKAFMDLARFGNQYFDSAEPWALLRKDKEACGAALNLSLQIVKALAVMAYPYLPFSSEEIWKSMGFAGTVGKDGWKSLDIDLPAGTRLPQPKPVFKKIEIKIEEEEDFPSFKKLDLRVGKIKSVEMHPNADKLYVETVDIGREIKIVSGLKGHYTPEELKDRSVVIVVNLEPATLRGVKSEGMLLAAESEGVVSILIPARDVPAGTAVSSGQEPSGKSLSFSDFQKLQIVVGEIEGDSASIGTKMPCTNCDQNAKDRKIAFFVEGGKALSLRCQDGTYITVDKEVPPGARVK
jgi:methionyl-tRNA synthetase